MQPSVTLVRPTSASNVLIVLLTRFIKETALKIQVITTRGTRSHEKNPITFVSHNELGDLLRQLQEASANLASLLSSGHQTVDPIIDYCFFEGKDLERLRACGITRGRRLIKLSEEDLLAIHVSKDAVKKFVSTLTAHCFQLPKKRHLS